MLTTKSRVGLSSALGATFTWYDFIIFNIATAIVFPKLFFPEMGYMLPLLIFVVGFLIRPLGSFIYGSLGDRFGRRKTLVSTLYITGISTVAIGLLPTYESAGILATVLLIVARIAQSLAFGGEWAAASTMVVEYNQDSKHKGLIASVVSSGFAVASIGASAMFMLATSFGGEFFMEYGWRIPFLLSAVLLAVGAYIRHKLLEPPEFLEALNKNKLDSTPIKTVVTKHYKPMLAGGIGTMMGSSWNYVVAVFGVGYILQQGLLTRPEITNIQFVATVALLVALVFFGWLGDKIGRDKLLFASTLVSFAMCWPIITWISEGNFMYAMLALLLVTAPNLASCPGLLTEIFPTSVRQSGSGISFNIGSVLGASLSGVLAAKVYQSTGDIMSVAVMFLIMTAIASAASLYLIKLKNAQQAS